MDASNGLNRRHALGGLAVGLSLPVLAACGDDNAGGSGAGSPTPTATSSEMNTPRASEDGSSPATGLIATADVPVGSGVVLSDTDLVITQPTKGDFKAFSSTCTHMGCKVSSVDTAIHCACHSSSYSITDGSVQGGPAPEPLPEEAITVADGQITAS